MLWTDLGRAPRTIGTYGRGLAEYLLMCEREDVDPVTANRAHVRSGVGEPQLVLPGNGLHLLAVGATGAVGRLDSGRTGGLLQQPALSRALASHVSRTGWQLLISPDDFAVRDVAGSPSAGQLSDEEEAAAVFVGVAGLSHKRVAVAGVGDFAGQHLVPDEA